MITTSIDNAITTTNTIPGTVALDEAALDLVSGGDHFEMAYDSRFLNSLNGSTDRYGSVKCWLCPSIMGELEAAWKKLGVDASEYDNGDPNVYLINGNAVSQDEAMQYAMDKTGHHMARKDWDW